jgi:hypothetical protein
MKNLIKLHTDSAISINRLAELLHENGIASMIKDNNAAGSIAGFGTIQNSVDLFIKKEDFEKSCELAQNFNS